MKKTLLLFAICSSLIATAQTREYEAGDKSVAITINPIFNYVGNLFNDNGSNTLNLSSTGLIYRKFSSPEKALRISGNVSYENFSSFSNLINFTNNNFSSFTTTFTSLSTNIGIGTEYRKNKTNWSLYAGWQILAAYNSNSYTVDSPDGSYYHLQITEFNSGARFSAGPGIFGGAEYFLGDIFFIGMEVSAAALAGYQFAPTATAVDTNQGGFILMPTEGKNSFVMDVNSMNIVAFRAGVRF